MNVRALLLCAGYGTRLGSLTEAIPKPLLPLAERPLIAYALANLADAGIRHVALNLHYRPEMIRQAIGDGSKYGLEIHYVLEPQLLGTAGAVANLHEYFSSADQILVIYGDLLFDLDLTQLLNFQQARNASATLVMHERDRSNSMLDLDDDGRITAFLERPSEEERVALSTRWVNSGIQVLRRELISKIPKGRAADLPRDLYIPNLQTEQIYGFPIRGYRCAIDSKERYEEARAALAQARVKTSLRLVTR